MSDAPVLDDIQMCPNCKAFHTDNTTGRWIAEQCKQFDPQRLCALCNEPVIGLSFGGPSICPPCDAGVSPSRRST